MYIIHIKEEFKKKKKIFTLQKKEKKAKLDFILCNVM